MPGDTPAHLLHALIPGHYAGQRLDLVLAQLFPEHSRARMQTWIRQGMVRLNDRTPEVRTRVWGGESVTIDPPVEPATTDTAEDIALDIVFQDKSLLVIDKPPGLVVHPGSGVRDGTLMNALLHFTPDAHNLPRAGIVHRLDKDTSGLMVAARTLEAHTELVRQLQARSVTRVYLALVLGRVRPSGSVSGAIGRHPTHRTKMAVTENGRPAVTHFKTLRAGQRWSLVRCQLETGRTHQIRVHMAELGHPLIGDPTYGQRGRENQLPEVARGFARQALHATELALSHPEDGTPMRWHRDAPADFQTLLSTLESSDPAQ